PGDQPMHIVREDPEQEGLLYAGTLEGAYVSFDQGKHWQTLQQNLPATPVTDIKVHHGDLVIATMGRSFWIMYDIAPLRQIAASVTKPTRTRPTNDNPIAADPRVGPGADTRVRPYTDAVPASMQRPMAPVTKPEVRPGSLIAPKMQPSTAAIKPFDGA